MTQIPSFINPKFLIINVIFLIAFFTNSYLHAQDLDFKYKVDAFKNGNEVRYNITVIVDKGIVPVTVKLFEELDNGKFVKLDVRKDIQLIITKFIKLSKKEYVIVVEDNKKSILKKINLSNNQNL
jgi:hypothetical protein